MDVPSIGGTSWGPIRKETPGAKSALAKLRKFAERHEPQYQQRNLAAKSLFENFAKIAGAAGLMAHAAHEVNNQNGAGEKYSLLVNLPRFGDVFVRIVSIGGKLLFETESSRPIPELEYNPVLGCFEGKAADGKPVEGVDALADVVLRELEKAWAELRPQR